MNKQYDSLKVKYSLVDNLEDDRLIPVDILVMHDGINHNYSSFSKESMEYAKETLKNVPILAYVKENIQGDKDFAGHEMEVSLKENKDGELEFKVKYLERPIGVIPETNDYHYEERDGKIYVGCRGYLWREYLNEGLEILQENPSKSVSMEISIDDANWNDEIGAYDITKYKYLGVTVLGDTVSPAMDGAKMDVSGHFSIQNKDFFEKVKQLNNELKKAFQGGENGDMTEENANVEVVEDVIDEKVDFNEEDVVEVEEVIETIEDEIVEEFDYKVEFEQINNKYTSLLDEHSKLKDDFAQLTTEAEELRGYKNVKESEIAESKKDEVIADYSLLLTEEEIEFAVGNKNEMNYEEIELSLSKAFASKSLEQVKSKKTDKKDNTVVFEGKNFENNKEKNRFAI